MAQPNISIAIPTYNRIDSLKILINQLIPQLVDGDEILVMDDNSTDNTGAILKYFNPIRLIVNNENQGLTRNWNLCLSNTQNEWICIIHDDDLVANDFLYYVRKACILNIGPTIIFHSFAGGGCPSFRYKVWEPGRWSVLNSSFIPSGIAIHRTIVNSVGGFDEHYSYSPDLEFFARVCSKFTSVIIENPKIINYNTHKNNYRYETWLEPDFLVQLEKIYHKVISYAGLLTPESEDTFSYLMNKNFKYMLEMISGFDNKKEAKALAYKIFNEQYTYKGNKLKALLLILSKI